MRIKKGKMVSSWLSVWFSIYPYISQSILLSSVTLVAALAVIKAFGIRDPKMRTRFFTVPFVAPVVIPFIIQHTGLGSTYLAVGPLDGLTRTFTQMYQGSSFNAGLFALICLMPIVISGFKGLLSYASVRRLVSKSRELTKERSPSLFALLDDLVVKSGVNYPRIILLRGEAPTAFAYGFHKPVLAISERLLSELKPDELKNVLVHELGHIARKDGLLLWASKVLRDLMFYNPIGYWLAIMISREKEKACDLLVSSWMGDPRSYAKTLLKVWRMALEAPSIRRGNLALSNLPHLAKEEVFLKDRIERLLATPATLRHDKRLEILAWFAFLAVELLLIRLVMVPVWTSTVCGFTHLG